MNTKRELFALIYFQSKIWVIGGSLDGNCIYTIKTYNLTENKWTTVDAKLQSKRSSHSAIVHNQSFFVVGGHNQNKPLSSVEVYSSETNQFSFVSQMNPARAFFGSSIFNNSLIVFGGMKLNLLTLLKFMTLKTKFGQKVQVYHFR